MLKLILPLILLIIVISMNVWVFIDPEGYRKFLRNHPLADHTGKWQDASDTKIRITSGLVILYLIACIVLFFKILNLLGIL